MRILMLSWEYPPRIVGGISRVVYDLAQNLGSKGNEVHVVTCMDKNTKEFEKDKNVYVHRVHTVGPDTKGDFLKWILHMNFSSRLESKTDYIVNQNICQTFLQGFLKYLQKS